MQLHALSCLALLLEMMERELHPELHACKARSSGTLPRWRVVLLRCYVAVMAQSPGPQYRGIQYLTATFGPWNLSGGLVTLPVGTLPVRLAASSAWHRLWHAAHVFK